MLLPSRHSALRVSRSTFSKSTLCLVPRITIAGRGYASTTDDESSAVNASQEKEQEKEKDSINTHTSSSSSTSPSQAKAKTQAQLDAEVLLKLQGLDGDGGAAGIEYEDGKPVSMKRGVRSNMFRYI